jgi:hypothetical protein
MRTTIEHEAALGKKMLVFRKQPIRDRSTGSGDPLPMGEKVAREASMGFFQRARAGKSSS